MGFKEFYAKKLSAGVRQVAQSQRQPSTPSAFYETSQAMGAGLGVPEA
jgi:hypothetical protein